MIWGTGYWGTGTWGAVAAKIFKNPTSTRWPPIRTAFMTGRYQPRIGGLECAIDAENVGRYDHAMWLSERKTLGLPADESTLMHALKSKGYQTALLAKWHLGYDREFRPDRHEFDYSLCLLEGLERPGTIFFSLLALYGSSPALPGPG